VKIKWGISIIFYETEGDEGEIRMAGKTGSISGQRIAYILLLLKTVPRL
jgi:hypothetical protein